MSDRAARVIVTGLSGSGKSVALASLEDLGYYCVDNLPTELAPVVLEHLTARFDKVALGLDIRGGRQDLADLPAMLDTIRVDKLIFLTADDRSLIRRYSETRRKHPLDDDQRGVARAIAAERSLFEPLRDRATDLIDTSALSVHQLRREICNALGASHLPLVLLIESFAYKRGVPADVDVAFDARCLPNPHWEHSLRPFTGRDPQVARFLEQHEIVLEFVNDIRRWVERWLPRFEHEQRNYLTLGIGCTGGKHRSVYVAEALTEQFLQQRSDVMIFHRELM